VSDADKSDVEVLSEEGDKPVIKKPRKQRVARVFNKLAKVVLNEVELQDFKMRVLELAHGDALKNADQMLDNMEKKDEDYEGSVDLVLTDPPWQVTNAKHDKAMKSKIPALSQAMFGLSTKTGTVCIRVSWQLALLWWNALNDAGFMMEPQLLVVVKKPSACVYRTKVMKFRSNSHYYYVVGHKTSKYYESDAHGDFVLENEYPHLASVITGVPMV
jgi:hypothetical protein